MKFKILSDNDYRINPVRTILKNRGIEDHKTFLNIGINHTYNFKLLKNIEFAVDILMKHLNKKNKIFIQIDSDIDGYTSSAIIVNYLHKISPNIDIIFNFHSNKSHGINSKDVPDDIKLVIVPDAGSNDYLEHKRLYNRGIDVIVLDHHNCDKYSPYAIVVNNQMCNYPNKHFSGVGITYKFCKAIDNRLRVNYANNYLDLVAVGNIADMMDTRNLETRYYILQGLKNINNPLIKAILDKQRYQLKEKVNIKTISWNINPYINAVIRFGNQNEKRNMFKSMLDNCTETLSYKKHGITEEIQQPMADAMARISANIKTKQNKNRDKGVALLEQKIIKNNLSKNKVLIINSTGILDENLIGLVTMQLAHKYRRPCILLKLKEKIEISGENKVIYSGSARGYESGIIKNFRQFILETNCFNMVQGHNNAFGIEIDAQNIKRANNIINKRLKYNELDNTYYVDFIIPYKHINTKLIKSLDKLKNVWGTGVEQPSIAITDIPIHSKKINLIGKNKDILKFKVGDIEFIKFQSSREEYKKLTTYDHIKFELIGKFSLMNNMNKSPQILIDSYNYFKSNN